MVMPATTLATPTTPDHPSVQADGGGVDKRATGAK